MTKRKSILNNIKATIETIATIGGVFVNRILPINPLTETDPFPVVLIESGDDTAANAEGDLGYDIRSFLVIIEIVNNSNNLDIEELLELVYEKVFSDSTQAGNAINTLDKGIGAVQMDFDTASHAQSIGFIIEVQYEIITGSL